MSKYQNIGESEGKQIWMVREVRGCDTIIRRHYGELPRTLWDDYTDQLKKIGKQIMSECLTPGCCTCPNMTRCQGCGYTKHDKEYWQDHRYCHLHKSKKKLKESSENDKD